MEQPQKIFKQLSDLGIISLIGRGKSYSKISMLDSLDVSIDLISITGPVVDMAISSYWRHSSGDMMACPDIQVRYNTSSQSAHVRAFQKDGVPHVGTVYIVVYSEEEEVNEKYEKPLNKYLEDWLGSLINQNYKF